MQEKQNIEELFRAGFNNFEEPVRPELWNNISAKIGASAPAPSPGTPSPVVESVVTTSKITASVATWITAAAVVVSGIAGYIYYSSTHPQKAAIEIQEPVNQDQINITPPSSSEISDPSNSAPATTNGNEKVASGIGERKSSTPASSTKISDSNPIIDNGINGVQNSPQSADHSVDPVKSVSHQVSDSGNEENSGSSESNNENVDKPTIKAYPSIGYAPLAVSFSTNDETQQTEWDFSDGTLISKSTPFEHVFNKPGIYPVTVRTNDSNGNTKTEVIKIEVLADLNIKNIPNVFTPNMDGKNDIFTFDAENIIDLEVSIFDKTGKLIYKWTGLEKGWDGKNLAGQEVEGGTYFYVIFATGSGQQKHQQGGTITLIR